jgi:hypothetical protein
MITASYEFNEDGFRRKILEAAEAQVREKLRVAGIHSVRIKAVAIESGGVRFEFSGESTEIQKAKAALGYQN